MLFENIARENSEKLKKNSYPGRGIVLGLNNDGDKLIQIYWIMGRSENSRNRIFIEDDGFVRTKAFDDSKLKDPSLIIYYPLKVIGNYHIISNGDQTDTVYDALKEDKSFEAALMSRTFEPDGPNYTPRITGLMEMGGQNAYSLSISKTQDGDPETCIRNFFNYEKAIPAIGHCIHTYEKDGEVLPSFSGEPYIMPILNTIEENIEFYWPILNSDNRVSLLAKSIEIATGKTEIIIKNRHVK